MVVRRDERRELVSVCAPWEGTFAPCSLAAAVSFFASKGSTTAPVCDGSSMTRYIQLSVRAWTGMIWCQLSVTIQQLLRGKVIHS